MYKYSFEKTINSDKLNQELTDALIPAINIETVGEALNIYYAEELNEDSQVLLTTIVENHTTEIILSQEQLDLNKYKKRSIALSDMLSQMAAENVGRVRSGAWSLEQLMGLTQDPQIKEILTDLFSLSFEIAYSKIDALTNTAITSDIKTQWKTKLAQNF